VASLDRVSLGRGPSVVTRPTRKRTGGEDRLTKAHPAPSDGARQAAVLGRVDDRACFRCLDFRPTSRTFCFATDTLFSPLYLLCVAYRDRLRTCVPFHSQRLRSSACLPLKSTGLLTRTHMQSPCHRRRGRCRRCPHAKASPARPHFLIDHCRPSVCSACGTIVFTDRLRYTHVSITIPFDSTRPNSSWTNSDSDSLIHIRRRFSLPSSSSLFDRFVSCCLFLDSRDHPPRPARVVQPPGCSPYVPLIGAKVR